MNCCSDLLTIILPIVVLLSNLEYKVKADTRIYVIKENKDAEESGRALRSRRQSHPDATVARIRDNSAFTPINGPAPANEQQNIPNSDLTNDDSPLEPGLIDYLVPPQPNAQISNQNFQDPAANLLTSSDILIETTPSTSIDVHQFQPTFSLPTLTASSNQNQILVPSSASPGSGAVQTSSPVSSNVQGITFQNSAPSLTAPTPALLSPSPTTQFSVSREAANQFLRNEIGTQLEQQQSTNNEGKWDLGFEAGEILSPPQQDLSSSSNRNQAYETLNVKRPNAAFNNPIASATLTVASTNNRFNIIPTTGSQSTDVFQKDDRQINIIWGSQKQVHGSPNAGQNYIPTTALPFLPTAASVSNSNNRFSTGATAAQFSASPGPQIRGFNSISGGGPAAALQLIEQQPAFSSQFDSYLSQGTVSDYTLFPFRETFRRYQRIKRQTIESPDEGNNEEDEEQETTGNRRSGNSDSVKPIGPVYSFVKTDKDGHYKWSVRHPSRR